MQGTVCVLTSTTCIDPNFHSLRRVRHIPSQKPVSVSDVQRARASLPNLFSPRQTAPIAEAKEVLRRSEAADVGSNAH
ncbi:MAG: hypothetical protein ACI82G_003328 [Bradymonadia bacterium]|jgi:hypothetical protein